MILWPRPGLWQPTDRHENVPGILSQQEETQLANLKLTLTLDVTNAVCPCNSIDALFSDNTLLTMNWDEVRIFFERLPVYLNAKALVFINGPFKYNGAYAAFGIFAHIRECYNGLYQPRHYAEY